MERLTEVFVEIHGKPNMVGRLWSRSNKGRESASFEYDKNWISSEARFPLEPLLTMDTGIHHSQPGKPLFGAIGDSAPDRWGRALMRRAERKNAKRENRTPRTLMEIDYLLCVDDRFDKEHFDLETQRPLSFLRMSNAQYHHLSNFHNSFPLQIMS
jgi:serine/threonine-protein kinase HipA